MKILFNTLVVLSFISGLLGLIPVWLMLVLVSLFGHFNGYIIALITVVLINFSVGLTETITIILLTAVIIYIAEKFIVPQLVVRARFKYRDNVWS